MNDLHRGAVDRPHPVLDFLCPICLHAIRDHFAYKSVCAQCWREGRGDAGICLGLSETRTREEWLAAA